MKSNHRVIPVGCMLLMCVALPIARAAEDDVSAGAVSLDIASAYVFRGATLNDGWVAQPALSVSPLPGLSLGLWANLDLEDYGGRLKDGQFSEVDL